MDENCCYFYFCGVSKEIFPIIESIIVQPQFKDNSFVKQLKFYKKSARKPMCSTITWRNVKLLLDIQDLNEYRVYLQKCPSISKYIRMCPSKSTQSGFDYGIIPQPSPTDASYEFVFPSASSSSTTDSETITNACVQEYVQPDPKHVHCTTINTSEDFQVFHQRVFTIVYAWAYTSEQWNYLYPEKWRHAIETGMDETSSWDQVQALMHTCTFQQYYESIVNCGPLHQCYEFSWEDRKIHNCVRKQISTSGICIIKCCMLQ